MALACQTPPVIIMGMHRSGTTLLAEALQRLGVYMGPPNSSHCEARFFHGLNVRMMSTAGGSWEYPEPIDRLLALDTLRELQREYLESLFRSPQAVFYLGVRRYLKHRSLFALDYPWGWKDPRNTFTLPFWLDVFPNARVLMVDRHGVDVANSLMTRHYRQVESAVRRHRARMVKYRFRPKHSHFIDTVRCANLEDGLALWMTYMRRAEENLARVPDTQKQVLRYEDILADPEVKLSRVADFCGAEYTAGDLRAVVDHLRRRRAYAYRQDEDLLAFARAHRDSLERFGYAVE